MVLEQEGADEDLAIAALLHDAVEDQGGKERLADIRSRFGDRAAAIVRSCGKSETSSRAEKEPWPVRKDRYLDHLRTASDEGALTVSAADKLHNARAILADYRTLGEQLWSRFNAGRDDLLWYYRSLADIFGERRVPLAEEVGQAVAELHRLAGSANGSGTPWRRHEEAGGVLICDGEVLLRKTGTGHYLPMWAAMWRWRLGHDRRPQCWRKIGSAARALGFPKQGKPPGPGGHVMARLDHPSCSSGPARPRLRSSAPSSAFHCRSVSQRNRNC